MTDQERAALQRGDRVVVRMDDGTERNFFVKYEPWVLAHGTALIGLDGIVGGYLLSRVVRKCHPLTRGKPDDTATTD
jgi:hypothetical protein